MCKSNAYCKAFIHNKGNRLCKVLDDSIPTHPNQDGFQFCRKAIPGMLPLLYMSLSYNIITNAENLILDNDIDLLFKRVCFD